MKINLIFFRDVIQRWLGFAFLALFLFITRCAQEPAFIEKYGTAIEELQDNIDVDNADAVASYDSVVDSYLDSSSNLDDNSNNQDSSNSANPPLIPPSLEEDCAAGTAPLNECLPFYTFVTKSVTQVNKKKVDILWVIDNSGSMSEEQTFLKNSFSYFINQLVNLDLSFQMAVTSTDVCEDVLPPLLEDRACPIISRRYHHRGSFVGSSGSQVLHNDTFDLINIFKTYTSLGTSGSGFEHGLKASQLAIQKVISGENDALLRDDAFLSIIVISDEEDDGIGLSQKDAFNGRNFWEEGLTRFRFTDDDLINYLKTVKGAGKFSVSAIAATADEQGKPCVSAHANTKEIGQQYISVANKTGGILESICDTNWDNLLTRLGADIGSQITQISLDSIPVPNTIIVKVEGQLWQGWSYISGTNTIKFASQAIPPYGSHIDIEYYTMR